MSNILIIGYGKVGRQVADSFTSGVDIHDPALGLTVADMSKYEYALVCVDTLKSHASDYKSLTSALSSLKHHGFSGVAVIRSTVSPEFVEDVLIERYSELRVVLFPEFFTDKELSEGKATPRLVVLGGDTDTVASVDSFLRSEGVIPESFGDTVTTSMHEAALIKLSSNSILATKVAMFNAIKLVSDSYSASYEVILDALSRDPRLGATSHSAVPSPDDGKYGFGGDCLPKDTRAMAAVDKSGFFDGVLKVNKYLGR